MSLTLPEISAICEEIDACAVPSGVQKVYERDERAVVLQLRGGGETRYLMVDTTPEFARIHFVESKPRQPPEPRTFTMLLRKHIAGAGFAGGVVVPEDRIVRLQFSRRSDEGTDDYELIAELTGRHGNLFLVRDGRILGQQHTSGGTRELRPGTEWEPPPPPPSRAAQGASRLEAVAVGQRSELLDSEYERLVADAKQSELRRRLSSGLKREAKRLRRLQSNIESDLQKAEDAQEYRRYGELLQSAYGMEVPRGAESIEVPDYYAEGAPSVAIPLDAGRSLQQNIERYFHEYRRLTGAIDQIETRLMETMERLEQVDEARAKLREADGTQEIEELADEVETRGLLREKKRQRRRSRSDEPPPPYRTFTARSGATILVGRGAKHNDALTTKVARGRDLWLHARDWAGAHVVLRMDKEADPDGEDLLDAAVLAAHFSRGRGDSLVDVTHTRAKHVRKPKGAAAGLVTVAGGSTIGVVPDPARLERLLATEEQH